MLPHATRALTRTGAAAAHIAAIRLGAHGHISSTRIRLHAVVRNECRQMSSMTTPTKTLNSSKSVSTPRPRPHKIISGIQPSGSATLGNYLGAILPWVRLQRDGAIDEAAKMADEALIKDGSTPIAIPLKPTSTLQSTPTSSSPSASFISTASSPLPSASRPPISLFLADLHALTVHPNPADLHAATYDLVATLLSCGIDPQRCTLFAQSHVPQHVELSWILTCLTPFSWMSNMTQFKEKAKMLADGGRPGAAEGRAPSLGLFAYPVLQAADILLYQATMVPVGNDQIQHVELCRDVASQFNLHYAQPSSSPSPSSTAAASSSSTPFSFPVPSALTTVTARVMSLRDGTKKMSKSDPTDAARINLTDTPDAIRKKIRKAVTDSDLHIEYDEEKKPETANLIRIMAELTERNPESIVSDPAFQTKKQFKDALTDTLVSTVHPIREEFLRLKSDESYLRDVLRDGAERASEEAEQTMKHVRDAVGLTTRR